MALNRQDFLLFLGAGAGTVALISSLASCNNEKTLMPFAKTWIESYKQAIGKSLPLMIFLRTPDAKKFMQKRHVPIGSKWSDKPPNAPPKPAVVAIRRFDAKAIT